MSDMQRRRMRPGEAIPVPLEPESGSDGDGGSSRMTTIEDALEAARARRAAGITSPSIGDLEHEASVRNLNPAAASPFPSGKIEGTVSYGPLTGGASGGPLDRAKAFVEGRRQDLNFMPQGKTVQEYRTKNPIPDMNTPDASRFSSAKVTPTVREWMKNRGKPQPGKTEDAVAEGHAPVVGPQEGAQPGSDQKTNPTVQPQTGTTNLPQNVAQYMLQRNAQAPKEDDELKRMTGKATMLEGLFGSRGGLFREPLKQYMEKRKADQAHEAEMLRERHQQTIEDQNLSANKLRQQEADRKAAEDAHRSAEDKARDELRQKQYELSEKRTNALIARLAQKDQNLTAKDLPPDLSDTLGHIAALKDHIANYKSLPGTGPVGGSAANDERTFDTQERLGNPLGLLGKKTDGSNGTADDARDMRLHLGQLAIGKEKMLSSAIFRNPKNMDMMRKAYGLTQTGSDAQIRQGVDMMEQAIKGELGQREAMASPGKATKMRQVVAGAQPKSQDEQAIEWAKDHMDDPRAKKILSLHGM